MASLCTSGVTISSTALSASIGVKDQPTTIEANRMATYEVTVKNTGSQTWPAGGANPVHLGIHFGTTGGGYWASSSTWATDQRFNLPSDVAPGQSATLSVTVNAPSNAGSYVIEYEMVQEQISWFGQWVDSQAVVGTGNPSFPTGTTYFTTTPDGQVISERIPNGSGGYTTYYRCMNFPNTFSGRDPSPPVSSARGASSPSICGAPTVIWLIMIRVSTIGRY